MNGFILIAGIILGILLNNFVVLGQRQLASITEVRGGGTEFINPLLECEIGEEVLTSTVRPFKNKVSDLTEKIIGAKKADLISVYFRDLNNGPWFGINEKAEFSPASLLKVPFMIAALKQAELNPDFFKKEVFYKSPADTRDQHFPPSSEMTPGKNYTIEEVARRMVVYSDNNAKDLLLKNITGKILSDVYKELGVDAPNLEKTDNFITVKNYATFFRILFNASYLNKEFSNKALKILSESEFKDGLVAGIPGNIKVAHKFGERLLNGTKQLHDCGIVYYPNRPYLLCVMTRGENWDPLTKTIADISKLVYQEVDKQ